MSKKHGELIPDTKHNDTTKRRHSIAVFKLMAQGKMSWATGAVYTSLWINSIIRFPRLHLNMEEIEEIKKDYNFDSDFLNYHIRNMKKLNLAVTIYEFESEDGKPLRVNNYKVALKLGIRGMKRSYLILKDLGK